MYEEDSNVLLGRGAYARVFKGRQKATKTPVAIKVISKDNKYFEQQQRGERAARARTARWSPHRVES